MCALDGQIALQQGEQDSVPDGPESVQVEAAFPPRRFPLPQSHRGTGWTLSRVCLSLDYGAGTEGGRGRVLLGSPSACPRSATYLTLDEVTRLVFRLELRLEHGGFAMELLVVFSSERFFFSFWWS